MSQASSSESLLKILLVENSRTARAVLVRALESQGYQVDTVASGTEAIAAILESDYHLVIMDVFLPQMNGYEAAQNIRSIESNKSNIPLIAFTSSTSERDKKICLDAGMDEYIIKSDDNKELFSVLEKYKKRLEEK
ncbi:response regulator [Candidatus Berkiella aquae]|uniref:Response regulator n=1 Tax=Candidatus Berkiella aquae TaxID=295108 RepID=A0A0Q9Z2V7_9GAMM|nr:response regulator [Candidatus Berkiella aquae]MCS5711753.1 response regulator [Candidatus Berkiella aquae]